MKPQNSNLDGLSPRRRLTSRQPLIRSGQDRTAVDLTRPRRGLTSPAMDAELKAIESTDQPPKKRRFRKGPKRPRSRLRRVVLSLAVLVIGTVGFLGVKVLIALQQITERNLNGGALALQDNIDPTQLKGEGDGRVNILAIGIGGEGHPGGQLADTIMIISIDPINNTTTMLSIPRDLYLKVPGFYSMRINEVHATGESNKQQKAKGGGPALLSDNLSRILGVPIHYFVRIDFTGFIQAVDTVGGVDINVTESVFDPFIENRFGSGKYGFSVKAGQQHFDGRTALQYGRSRKTSSDFARASRQQEVLVALKEKVLSLSTLTNPLKISSLVSAAGNHVRTDLSIDEIMKLIQIAGRIDSATVNTYVLSNAADNYLASRNIGGAAVLIPRAGLDNFSQIQKFVRSQLLVDGFIRQEAAQIVVLNGTTTAGLATKTADYLKGYGYNIIEAGDAPTRNVTTTGLYDQSGGSKPFTVKLLEKRLNVSVQYQSPPGVVKSADLIIVLGSDFKLP